MKEITRIHIAKVSYDIEISAKKVLEQYIGELSSYAADAELLQDIEVRMTELLAERGVSKDDIIADGDVQAVRAKLGEPEAFADDESEAVLPAEESSRRLYRDQDNAVVGGVLSGIAAFFRINPLWTRLAFIISIFISFGTMLLVYIVLWLAVPPARTAAEKLRMSGQPVTLAAIRNISEQDVVRRPLTERRVRIIKRIFTISAGIFCVFVAIMSLIAIAAAGWTFGVQRGNQFDSVNNPFVMSAIVLFIVSGLLLATLAIMGAYAAFARKFAKRQIISGIIIVVLGLGSFGAGLGMMGYQSWQQSDITQRNTKVITTKLPTEFSAVASLKINTPGVMTQYVISDTPHMTLVSLPNYAANYTLDGTSATISVQQRTSPDSRYSYSMPQLTIYGPALTQLDIAGGQVNYEANNQEALAVHILPNASESFAGDGLVHVGGGTIGTLTIVDTNTQWSTIDINGASVRHVSAQLRSGDTLQLGKIADLNVSYPDVCPTDTQQTTVRVAGLQASTMTVNQNVIPAGTTTTACGAIEFDSSSN